MNMIGKSQKPFLGLVFLMAPVFAVDAGMLMDFNQGAGHDWLGWQWQDDVAYGNQGWVLMETAALGKGANYNWGYGPRVFNKGGYTPEQINKVAIDNSTFAPSTSSGGSFKVYETPESTDHRTAWWVWYDGQPLSERGVTNDNTDRMSFYLKTEGMKELDKSGGNEVLGTNFHIGTYLCWRDPSKPAYGSGDGCPYEGPGNQHYYHYLTIESDMWYHVLLDQHPQHRRGSKERVPNNPPYSEAGKHYFAQLNQYYIEIRWGQPEHTAMYLDEIQYYATSDSEEPDQNEESITSLWVGYKASKNEWQLGFHDMSWASLGDNALSTFELRWSATPITNENYDSAHIIAPKLYSGIQYVDARNPHYFRRPNGWGTLAFTTFEVPPLELQKLNTIYFAVKDVSALGENKGGRWPWNKGDGHDAASPFIKTIDFAINGASLKPKAPVNLTAENVVTE
ncbi:MAG: hypothetical protein CMF25_00280 [Kangiellaceae bacterium]|nr:hypothetical protein [Kangiellaceae bacterium]|tara:strand:+ start:419 stop:1774 length:1356 start_codon:yes stop_codon:yes gene_type:complete